MNKFEQKQQTRRERLENAAASAQATANAQVRAAHDTLAHIPMGQPILVGHHSERRHRADLARSDRKMARAIELHERSEELRDRAAAVGTGGISADDPDALVKLQDELRQVQETHRRGLALNKAFKAELRRFGDAAQNSHEVRQRRLTAIDAASSSLAMLDEERDEHRRTIELFSWIQQPYQSSSGSSAIRRIKARIQELEAERAIPASADVRHDDLGLVVEDAPDDNRIRIRFDARVSDAAVEVLQREGWRWAPSVGAWQRQRNQATRRSLERVMTALREIGREGQGQ